MKGFLFFLSFLYLAGCSNNQAYDRGYVISKSQAEEPADILPAAEN